MNVRELTVFAAVSAMSLFSAVAADKPGVIVLNYDYIDAHFSNRHKRFDYVARDLNLLTDLIEEYNGSVDK